MSAEPEFITIVEGPRPNFMPDSTIWNESIYEGMRDSHVALVELRTMNGEDIRDRSLNAWQEGRPVQLDYPSKLGVRETIDVVALRLIEGDAGTVLRLWVHVPDDEMAEIFDGESDEDE